MLSKTELLPVRDRLTEADRHLAYVKGGIRHIKCVEDKRIVNELVGAIESQRKAMETMLEVLSAVAKHDYLNGQFQEIQRTEHKNMDRKEMRRRILRGELFESPAEEELVRREKSAA
jgi:predicted ABC-class ATPase